MNKTVFDEFSDDELVDYASLVQWVNDQIGQGVREMVVQGHTMRVINTVIRNFQEENWAIDLNVGRDASVLKFSPNMPKQKDDKPANCGIRPVST